MRCAAIPPGGGVPAPTGPGPAGPAPAGPAPAGSMTVTTPVPIATPVPMIGPRLGGFLGGRRPGRPSPWPWPWSVVETVVRLPLPLPLTLPPSVTTLSMLLLNRWKRGSERKLAPPPLKLGVRIVIGARGPAAKLPICAACEAVATTSATTAIAVETVRPTIKCLFGRQFLEHMFLKRMGLASEQPHIGPATRPDCGSVGNRRLSSPSPRGQPPGSPTLSSRPR